MSKEDQKWVEDEISLLGILRNKLENSNLYRAKGYDPEKDMNDRTARLEMEYAVAEELAKRKGKDITDLTEKEVKNEVKKIFAKEYARLKKEDNVAVREDSGARPSDLTKKYNNEMARGKGVNVLAPEPLKEVIVENTRAVLTGDQPMVFDKEIAGKLFEYVNGRPASHLDLLKMRVNAENSEKMYAQNGSSVSRVTAEVNKAVKAPIFEEERGTTVSGRNLYPSKPGHGNHPKSGSMEL